MNYCILKCSAFFSVLDTHVFHAHIFKYIYIVRCLLFLCKVIRSLTFLHSYRCANADKMSFAPLPTQDDRDRFAGDIDAADPYIGGRKSSTTHFNTVNEAANSTLNTDMHSGHVVVALPLDQQHVQLMQFDDADDAMAAKGLSTTTHVISSSLFHDHVRVEYYRKHLFRTLVPTAALALVSLFLSPIVGLVLLPASVLMLYWLIDTPRFQHGGDSRRFLSRDCCAMFLQAACAVCFCILLINAAEEVYYLNKMYGQDAPQWKRRPGFNGNVNQQQIHRHMNISSDTLYFRLFVNAFLTPLVAADFFLVSKLRAVLSPPVSMM